MLSRCEETFNQPNKISPKSPTLPFSAILIRTLYYSVTGEIRCSGDALKRINVSTELQSDFLLPCNFDPALLGSDRTADLSVVWSQINTTVQNLLEITLQGEEKFWDSKDRRIKPFAKLSESGNFSILLTKVQPSDLSLYRCELYNGTSCRTAYQEIRLSVRNQPTGWNGVNILVENWPYVAGGGAFALILLLVLTCLIKRARSKASDSHVYVNSRFNRGHDEQCSGHKHSSDQHRARAKNEVYVNKPQNHRNIYANSHIPTGEIYVNQIH